MQLFIKNESGEFQAATESQLDEVFREKSGFFVSKRLNETREKEAEKLRPELEKKIHDELEPKLKEEAKAAAEAEFMPKLEEATKRAEDAELALRRKTIAAEYGFKAETEEFLGNGTEDEMRAKADKLKESFATTEPEAPRKETATPKSSVLESTGLDIRI